MKRIVMYIVVAILVFAGFLYFIIDNPEFHNPAPDEDSYEIVREWNLPEILKEVSGISWIENDKIASVQDEKGIIFIYNLRTSEIEKQIEFGEPEDYEGIAIHNKTAYVLRSDGEIYEVKNFLQNNKTVNRYSTPLTVQQDIEGLGLDRKGNRLLLAIKDSESDTDKYKGVYAFDLLTNEMEQDPVFKINMEDQIFNDFKGNLLSRVMSPSEITVHPRTGDMYILDGRNPKLLVADQNGNLKKLIFLNLNEFNQPEGLTFSPSGKLYISNEGSTLPANILEVELKNR